jgi:hypothetical protein
MMMMSNHPQSELKRTITTPPLKKKNKRQHPFQESKSLRSEEKRGGEGEGEEEAKGAKGEEEAKGREEEAKGRRNVELAGVRGEERSRVHVLKC